MMTRFLSVAFSLLVLLLLIPSAFAASDCSTISGVSDYYGGKNDTGVVDFDYGDYAEGEERTKGKTIDDDDKVCVDVTTGDVEGFVWNTGSETWFLADWCLDGVCGAHNQPQVDLSTGYWSGYFWSNKIGWIWLDWTCTSLKSCDTADRVHTDLSTGEVSGYAYNSRVGWINFGGGDVTLEELEFTIYPVVEVSPDPVTATKYGDGSDERVPLADGLEEYVISVGFYVVDPTHPEGGYYLTDSDIDFEMEITPSSDSMVCFDQINHACDLGTSPPDLDVLTQAVFFPEDALYNSVEEVWEYPVRSLAPTSRVNGYDSDGDGAIDYYFDVDPDDPDARSESVNQYVLESLDFTVTPLASLTSIEWDESDPLYGLADDLSSGNDYTLEFAPPFEVANLERLQLDNGEYVPYVSATVDEEQVFKGLVVNWATALGDEFFKVHSTIDFEAPDLPLGYKTGVQDEYHFYFDMDGDGYVHPEDNPYTQDDSYTHSRFSMYGPGDGKLLDDYKKSTTRYVPVEVHDWFLPLSGGTSLDAFDSYVIEKAMMLAGSRAQLWGDPTSPRYETKISWEPDDPDTNLPVIVRYYSNYIPQSDLSTGYQDDIEISGSVTSITGDETGASSSDDVVVLGDISTLSVRNELFKRFSELTKGLNPSTGGASIAIISDDLDPVNDTIGVQLFNDDDSEILYYKDMDVRLKDLNSDYAAKTIVVWGGDVYIQDELASGEPVAIVAFKDADGNHGHVYVGESFTELLNVHIFAEGSVFGFAPGVGVDSKTGIPTWTSSESRNDYLRNQLMFLGTIVSANTIYGSDATLAPNYVLPDGTTTRHQNTAKEYDLNRLREFTLCWKSVDILGNPVDYDKDGITLESDGSPDMDDVQDCSGADRSVLITEDDDYYNAPVHFEYSPTPFDLPILGGSEASTLRVF